MKSSKLEPSCCPYCKAMLDAALSLQDNVPNPGDITICNICGEVCELDENLKLKEIPEIKLQGYFQDNPMLREMCIQIQQILRFAKVNPNEN